MSDKEKRYLEIRASENEEMIVEGYAVVFDQVTDLGWCKEIIAQNSLSEADMKDCVLRYNHDDSRLSLARTRNGSLTFEVDGYGLKIRAKICDTTEGRDLYKMVKEGYVDKMSFAFTTREAKWDYETDTRTITKIDKLYDVSIVDLPAYEGTDIYARSKEKYNTEKEQYLKEKEEKRQLDLEKEKIKFKLDMM